MEQDVMGRLYAQTIAETEPDVQNFETFAEIFVVSA